MLRHKFKKTNCRFHLACSLLLFIISMLTAVPIHAKSVWYDNLEEALQYAEANDKQVFIHFTGSDWCPWCVKLDENVLSTRQFTDFAQNNLALVKIDFPKKIKLSEEQTLRNNVLAQKYRVRGFPTIILLDSAGEHIGTTGFRRGSAQAYIKHLQELLE